LPERVERPQTHFTSAYLRFSMRNACMLRRRKISQYEKSASVMWNVNCKSLMRFNKISSLV
jgi:hypothetical protein